MSDPVRVVVSRVVSAPPAKVYRILSDYREHHPRILPKPEFEALHVEEGGSGAGTLIRVEMRVMGRARAMRMRVEEPEVGRVLREVDVETGDATTFTVEPAGMACRVSIETVWAPKGWFAGLLERSFNVRVAKKLYERELLNLDAYAKELA